VRAVNHGYERDIDYFAKEQQGQKQQDGGVNSKTELTESAVAYEIYSYKRGCSETCENKLFFPEVCEESGLAGRAGFCGVANGVNRHNTNGQQRQRGDYEYQSYQQKSAAKKSVHGAQDSKKTGRLHRSWGKKLKKCEFFKIFWIFSG
jgi:hypothetical protein